MALAACQTGPPPLTADIPLHLEEHLDQAIVTGSAAPANPPSQVEWRFDEPQPDWKPVKPLQDYIAAVRMSRTEEGLVLHIDESNDFKGRDKPNLIGALYAELPDWKLDDWDEILVRARTTDKIEGFGIGFNVREPEEFGPRPFERSMFRRNSIDVPMARDGTEQTYRFSTQPFWGMGPGGDNSWRELGLVFWSNEPASVEVLTVGATPREARFSKAPLGVRTENRDEAFRRTIFTHTPSKLEYRLRIPPSGRLDLGLGALRDEAPVSFRVSARGDDGRVDRFFDETHGREDRWIQRSVDLSDLAGETVTLTLDAESERAGSVALWSAPTLSGAASSDKPNIIFYIIDGASAHYMSAYGYNRRTTPHIEQLAAEGALFEQAYSNASWTRPSTLSFLTGLQHSTLGGLRNKRNAPPLESLTIAEHLHAAGYQTAEFTTNVNAGTVSGLERGLDAMREAGVEPTSVSSTVLHDDFRRWREQYPGAPYWVHFQTSDVHWPHNPPHPFAGLYVSPERRLLFDEWQERLEQAAYPGWFSPPKEEVFSKAGIDRVAYFNAGRDLYAETMAHQDHQLGRFVERLKQEGDWDNTLLIIAADHGAWAGSEDYYDFTQPELREEWTPIFRPEVSRIPMVFVWPGRISPGQRLEQPVSMIDMLPTILDLAGLPQPEIQQGQSLAPLLLAKPGWEPRPVIFDEYEEFGPGASFRAIEVVDGRWGASLVIEEDPDKDPSREVRLELYDLWSDPHCQIDVREEHPYLAREYRDFLEGQLEAHLELGRHLTRSEASPLNAEQLETLRSLGYIQ